jgi:hypothetical protein
MDEVDIQLQDTTGNWRTFATTFNNSQMILIRMKELKDRYPDKRVRAIDKQGRLVDMM